jgi:hypothetical protein
MAARFLRGGRAVDVLHREYETLRSSDALCRLHRRWLGLYVPMRRLSLQDVFCADVGASSDVRASVRLRVPPYYLEDQVRDTPVSPAMLLTATV